mmetsp:Transcript_580/g.1304  ORF Transcript_580/g.1304 Transcript_580/m.1304 type:complete len:102 (-) Transcript_580:899-1204(-)
MLLESFRGTVVEAEHNFSSIDPAPIFDIQIDAPVAYYSTGFRLRIHIGGRDAAFRLQLLERFRVHAFRIRRVVNGDALTIEHKHGNIKSFPTVTIWQWEFV